MKLRSALKRLYYNSFFSDTRFRYFGSTIYFPKKSLIFRLACEQGIYEASTVRMINRMIRPGSIYIDVGANIGLMSVAALASRADCYVVSVEASPTTLNYLRRTRQASAYVDRWTVVEKAVSSQCGESTFYEGAPPNGAFDGLHDTGRGGDKQEIKVPVTTIDAIWNDLGRPAVSVIKMDIEGGELGALQGSLECIKANRPVLVTEWNELHFKPYGIHVDDLVTFAKSHDYQILSGAGLAHVGTATELYLHMTLTETYVLLPGEAASAVDCASS